MFFAEISTGDQLLGFSRYAMPFILSVAFSLPLTWAMIRLAPAFGLIDHPDERRIHKKPIPRAGGIAVFFSFHLAFLLSHLYFFEGTPGNLDFEWWLVFFPASFVLFVVGVIDDRFGMAAIVKLIGQGLAASVLFTFSDNSFAMVLGLEMPGWLNFFLTVLWCVALINAFNLIDGLDGLCAGLAIISSIGMAAAFFYRGMPGETMVLIALAGAALGFLRYNFHPAKIFLGDTGSMFLGFTLAAVSLETGGKSTLVVSVGIPLIAAGIPLMDTVLAVWRRSLRKILAKSQGKAAAGGLMGADKDHLHHRLLDAGLNQRKVAGLLYAGNVALVVLGLSWILSSQASLALFLIMLSITIYVVVRHVVHIELWDTGVLLASGLRRPGKKLLGQLSYPAYDLLWIIASFYMAIALADLVSPDRIVFRSYLAKLPLWVLPMMAFLTLSKTYARIWRLAVFRDFLTLVMAIVFGGLLSFSVSTAFAINFTIESLQFALFFMGLSVVGILGSRSLRHIAREWIATAIKDKKTAKRYETKNLLIYGAGDRGLLFLRDWMMVHPEEMAKNRVVGFVDDDRSLRKRYLYAHKILGTSSELPELIDRYNIDAIVICCPLKPSRADALVKLCRDHSLTLREWNRVQRVLLERGVDPQTLRKVPKRKPTLAKSEKLAEPNVEVRQALPEGQ